jgi:glycosyltransferase involved in cell wall biosynthesis
MSRTTVSICTPTYNRREFIPYLIKCIKDQTYPHQFIEWIVLDDGTDKVEDLFKDIPNIVYMYSKEKLPIGKKRNMLNDKAKNDIIIYFDDDDYYPPDRIKHAVTMLNAQKRYLIAGSSMIYMYYSHIDKIYSAGPYNRSHATAGTFAFRRELLERCRFEDTATFAEEKFFLHGFTVPMYQLNPLKTIIVLSHNTNTFDKKKLLKNKSPNLKETKLKLKKLVKNKKSLQFYKFIHNQK